MNEHFMYDGDSIRKQALLNELSNDIEEQDKESFLEATIEAKSLAEELISAKIARRPLGVKAIYMSNSETPFRYWYSEGPKNGQLASLTINSVDCFGDRVFMVLDSHIFSVKASEVLRIDYGILD